MCGVERGWGVELGFSVILVIVCSVPCKTLTRVWGGAGGGNELGFSVTLVVVCSAPCKTLTRVWDGAEVGRGGGLLSHFGGSVQCAS